jgi:serine/threonine protein phosphatase PrpC
MASTIRHCCAALSDPGRRRRNNEDRCHADPERGIFIVVDGVGGQAAGEKAAETALELLRRRLERQTGTVEERLREGIAIANNEVLRLASTNPAWAGMACVLTAAVVDGGAVTVGHVGDSRLYQLFPGKIRKLTHDHSPVGEREDAGELDEAQAMRHPRRNEVFRDVGSQEHTPDDSAFIEIQRAPFPPESGLLLCSDGLSDLVPSSQIREIVEKNAGEPQAAVQELVDAANEAGGKDNITVVLVEGRGYAAAVRGIGATASRGRSRSPLSRRGAFLLYGLALGALASWLLSRWAGEPPIEPPPAARVLRVGSAGASTIAAALAEAGAGDTIVVGPGLYHEQVRLKEGVTLISEKPREAVLQAPGVIVLAERITNGRFAGFRISGEAASTLVGVRLTDANVELSDLDITGARSAGIEILGASTGVVRASRVADNPGVGIVIWDRAAPRLAHNIVVANGRLIGGLRPGIDISPEARPVLIGNTIRDNGAEPVWLSSKQDMKEILRLNFIAGNRVRVRP